MRGPGIALMVAGAVVVSGEARGQAGAMELVNHLTGIAVLAPANPSPGDRNFDGRIDTGDVVRAMRLPFGTPTPTSTATATPSPTATVTPTVTPVPTLNPSEAQAVRQAFGTAYDVGIFTEDVIKVGVFAVFRASELNGSVATTGTLTSTQPNDETFTYSPTPTDRLAVVLHSGQRLEFIFAVLQGNTNSQEDFVDQHNMDFQFIAAGRADFRVQSQKDYVDNQGEPGWRLQWQRSITGAYASNGETVNLDVAHNGTQRGLVDSGYAEYQASETYTGSINAPSSQVVVSESSSTLIISNSSDGILVRNFTVTSNSSTTSGGSTYQFQDVRARWETYTRFSTNQLNVVGDPNYWIGTGTVLKNGQPWGTAQLSGPVIANTKGPDFVLGLGTGEKLLLHTLIADL